MRISDPKLFNGQTLATKQQISAWLAGTSDDSFGILSIPASNVKYGTNSNVSAQIANIYTKLGLDNSGEGGDETLLSRVATIENAIKVDANGNYIVAGSNVNTNLSNLDTNLKTVSGDLDTLETTVGELSDTLESVSGSLTGMIDDKADQIALTTASSELKAADAYISGIVDTVSGDLDTLEVTVGTLSDTLESVSGSLTGMIDDKADKTALESVSGSLKAADTYISGVVDTKADQATLESVSGALKDADAYISGIVDTKADQATLVAVSGKVNENATAISTLTTDYKAADAYISGVVDELSSWQTSFVDKTAVVEGTGLVTVSASDVDDATGVQTFTVNVPSSVAFQNHDIKLSGIATTEGYASSYALYVDGAQKGDIINIPKDQYLSGVAYDDLTNTLKFAWKLADNTITTTDVQITDLIDTISGGNGISTTGNTVSVKIKDGDKYITADASGLQTKGIDAAISAAVSGKAEISTVNAIDARLSGAEGEIDTLQTTVGKHATAIGTAITFEEVSLSGLAEDSSVTVEGRIMQVFDADGWVYPEVKFTTTNGKVSSTVTINESEWNDLSTEDKSKLSGLSGLVSKKVIIAE